MGMGEARTVLDALVAKWHLTRDAAAKMVSDAGCPVSGRHLAGIAGGARQPGAELAGAIERAFGMPIAELLAQHDERQWLPSNPPGRAVSSVVSPSDTQEAFALATQRAYQYKLAYQTRVDTSALADDVRYLARAYPQQPLGEVISPLVAAQQAIYEQLESGRIHTESARDLHFLAGVTTGMVAKAAHDSGDPARAIELARAASMASDLAGHRGLQAWVSGLQSLVSYWAGRPQESIRHARRAAELVGGTRSTVAVWAAVSEARAWARLGDAEQVQSALHTARSLEDRATGDGDDLDAFGGLLTFPRARGLYYSAEAAVHVGMLDEALAYGNAAVEQYNDPTSDYWAFGDAAGSSAALATAHVRRREVEEATAVLVPVLDMPPTQRINGIIKCVQPVYDALTSVNAGAAGHELGERIEAFTRVPMRIAQ